MIIEILLFTGFFGFYCWILRLWRNTTPALPAKSRARQIVICGCGCGAPAIFDKSVDGCFAWKPWKPTQATDLEMRQEALRVENLERKVRKTILEKNQKAQAAQDALRAEAESESISEERILRMKGLSTEHERFMAGLNPRDAATFVPCRDWRFDRPLRKVKVHDA